MPDEYPIGIVIVELVEAVAIVGLIVGVIYLWREIKVPEPAPETG